MIAKKYVDRFWSRVNKSDDYECWEWQAGKNIRGYGQMRITGKTWGAHRLSWTIHNGKIPKGMFVLHTCDNPPCVNPNHLFLGTHRDNMNDMYEKGRGNDNSGESNGQSKLTKDDVISIFYADGLLRVIGAKYGISLETVGQIKRKERWKSITKDL